MNKNDIKIIQTEIKYDGFFKIKQYRLSHRLFDGTWSDPFERECFERSDSVAVLPYDPKRDEVVLIKQCRVCTVEKTENPWLIELVAGMLDDEDPTRIAHREAKEEANLELMALHPIYTFWSSPGGSSERIFLYCGCVDATKAGGVFGLKTEHEDIQVCTMPFEQALKAIETGEINNGVSIIALQWLALHKKAIQTLWI